MSNEPIICEICKGKVHIISKHLKDAHPEVTIENYKDQYPDAPLLSELAKQKLEEQLAKKREAAAKAAAESAVVEKENTTETSTTETVKETTVSNNAEINKSALTAIQPKPTDATEKKPFHEIFELEGKSAYSTSGKPIPISCVTNTAWPEMVPETNNTYVWNNDELKDVMIA